MRGIHGAPYRSLDEFIDLTALPELETEIIAGIPAAKKRQSIFYQTCLFYRGGELVDKFYPDRPEVREEFHTPKPGEAWVRDGDVIDLRVLRMDAAPDPFNRYGTKGRSHLTDWTENSKLFPKLCSYFDRLPFTEYGRVMIWLTPPEKAGILHRDHRRPHLINDEFVWFRTSPVKSLYILDDETGEKHYVESMSALFNTTDYHGAEATSTGAFAVRVDGIFQSNTKEALGIADRPFW